MKKLLLPVTLFIASSGLLFILSEKAGFSGMPGWMLWLILAIAALIFTAMVVLLRRQVDDNPYYADMIRAKREEVHKRQQMAIHKKR